MSTINNITGQLSRISSAAITVWNKAKDMNLALPGGSYWDLNSNTDKTIYGTANTISSSNSGEASYIINSAGDTEVYNFGIDAAAAAINQINAQTFLGRYDTAGGNYVSNNNITLSENRSIYVPVGYNKNPYTITAGSISSQLINTTIEAKYLFLNKTAYAKYQDKVELITGTLSKVYLYNPTKAFNSSKIQNNYLQVSVNAEWETDNQLQTPDLLQTNIPYKQTQTTQSITGSSTEDGTVGIQSNLTITSYDVYSGNSSTDKKPTQYLSLIPTPGYYDTSWDTNIKYNPVFDNTVEITRTTDAEGNSSAVANTLVVPAGYYSKEVIITPQVKDIEGNIEDILNYTDISIAGDFTGDPFVLNPNSYNGKSYDYFGKVTIAKAVKEVNKFGQLNVTTGGWINKGLYGNAYGGLTPLTASHITSSPWDSTKSEISSQTFEVTVAKGHYNVADVTKQFTIRTGLHKTIDPTLIFNYNNAKFGGETTRTDLTYINKKFGKLSDGVMYSGWINAFDEDYYFAISDYTRVSTVVETADYHKVAVGGWIDANSVVGTSILDMSTNKGYNANTGVYTPINTSQLVINPGAVIPQKVVINPISVGEATYKIDSEDLSNSDDGDSDVAKFKVTAAMDQDGEVSSYMSAITIDMSLILNQLQQI